MQADLRLFRLLHAPIRLPAYHRGTAHLVFAALIWPLITIAGTSIALTRLPYYAPSARDAVLASVAGAAIRLPDFVLVGSLYFGLSWFIFGRLGGDARGGGRAGAVRLTGEPVVTFLAILAGVSLWYPAVLSLPLLWPLAAVPAAGAVLVLGGIVVLGALFTGRPGTRLRLALSLIAFGVLSPTPMWGRAALEPSLGTRSNLVVLGIDSISHSDDIGPFGDWVMSRGGTWYERAVAPGLLTNAVWTSVLTMRPVREHGVFHGFQRFPEGGAAFLGAARAHGYRTIAIFPDQLTAAVGSTAGFDEDRSGPIGWRQLLLPTVANNSLLLPVLTPALPRAWPGSSAPNAAGTFTYDVRREIRAILRSGSPAQRVLVAAHLTYTHLPAYPGSLELSWAELWRVARAQSETIRDRSLDWQDVDRPGDPLAIRRWKVEHLQRVIQAEVDAARYVDRGGQLVVFSDHGNRAGMTIDNFIDERYHHVVLATFGLPPRCPQQPISLIDIGSLAGFSDKTAEASVEFVLSAPKQWPALVESARLRWSGDVDLAPRLLGGIFKGLRRHEPWPDQRAGANQRFCGSARIYLPTTTYPRAAK
jgi:hypothetical protein